MTKYFLNSEEITDISSVEVHITQSTTPPTCPTGYTWDGTQCVQDPVEPPPEPTGTLLVDEAATMAEGEWRLLADKTTWPGKDTGSTFKGFQYVGNADGMGWTQPLVHHNGALMMLLCRDGGEQALMHMDPAGNFTRVEEPVGFGADGIKNGGRRPFNRLMQDSQYMMFAPRGASTEMGHIIRTPLDTPRDFESIGPYIGDDQMDSTGNFSMIWVEEWNRFYAYTPGGKIWSRAPTDAFWTRHADLQVDSEGKTLSGYAGMLVWNPIKLEILIQGGQYFGTNPDTSDKVYRITSPLGDPEMLANRKFPDGTPMYWNHAESKCLIHPADGSYLVIPKGAPRTFYRMVSGSGTAHLFDDFSDVGIEVVGRYELYTVFKQLPGTDVFAYISHIRGLGLYRPPSVAGLPTERETDPVLTPGGDTGGDNPPPTGSELETIAAETALGSMTLLGGSYSPYSSYEEYWQAGSAGIDQDTYGPTGFWDSSRKKLVYVRDRTPEGPINPHYVQTKLYDEATHSWTMGSRTGIDTINFGSPHSYGKQAYNPVLGHAYYISGLDQVSRYIMDEDRWEHFSVTSPIVLKGAAPVEFHEGINILIRPQGLESPNHLAGWSEGASTWTDMGALNGHTGYQALMKYNRVRGDMLLLGGTYNRQAVTIIDASGQIISKNTIPNNADGTPLFSVNIGGNMSVLTYDPLSGNYLCRAGNQMWEYNPDLDEWRLGIDFDTPGNEWMNPGPYYGWVFAPIDELGVIAWMNYYGTRLYRHQSVF